MAGTGQVESSQLRLSCDPRAPCSACTIPNNVSKSIEFELRGLCDRCQASTIYPPRSGFDTDYMINNDEETGLISYIGLYKCLHIQNCSKSGKKWTKIQFDRNLYQWNISVTNNPRISAISYSDVSTMVIGKHVWKVSGDFACSTQDQVATPPRSLAL